MTIIPKDIRDTTRDYLDKAYKRYKSPISSLDKKRKSHKKPKKLKPIQRQRKIRPITRPGSKIIKLSFNTGSFYIIRNVVEFVPGFKFLFVAYIPDGGRAISMIYEREDIEGVSMRDADGNFKTVKLKKTSKLGGWRNGDISQD